MAANVFISRRCIAALWFNVNSYINSGVKMRYVLTSDVHEPGALVPVYRAVVAKVDANWASTVFRQGRTAVQCMLDRDAFIEMPLGDVGLVADGQEVRAVAHMSVPVGHSLYQKGFDLVELEGYADRESGQIHPVTKAHAEQSKILGVERSQMTLIDERAGYYYVTALIRGRVVALVGPMDRHLSALLGLAEARDRALYERVFDRGDVVQLATNRLDPLTCKLPPDGVLETTSFRRSARNLDLQLA